VREVGGGGGGFVCGGGGWGGGGGGIGVVRSAIEAMFNQASKRSIKEGPTQQKKRRTWGQGRP